MIIWIDTQLSPALAQWITATFGVQALRDLGLRDALDREIFEAARRENVVVMTKNSNFLRTATFCCTWRRSARRPRCFGLPAAISPAPA